MRRTPRHRASRRHLHHPRWRQRRRWCLRSLRLFSKLQAQWRLGPMT
ncbi:unnamed protein product [Symbiodinium sp. CCMP2456]|nr:unnamed protein product [Symbiodinium sp. CCMP2456]